MDPNRLERLTLAFCAGTGRMGSNLARLYALAGFRVIIGSRDPAKAQALAQQLRDQHPDSQLRVEGASNAEAAAAADVVHWCIMVSACPGVHASSMQGDASPPSQALLFVFLVLARRRAWTAASMSGWLR